jgi:hypothetical protein
MVAQARVSAKTFVMTAAPGNARADPAARMWQDVDGRISAGRNRIRSAMTTITMPFAEKPFINAAARGLPG